MKGIKLFTLLLFILIFSVQGFTRTGPAEDEIFQDLIFKAQSKGEVRVILKLKVPNISRLTKNSSSYKTGISSPAMKQRGFNADLKLEDAIFRVTDKVLLNLNKFTYKINRRFSTVPFLALSLSPEALIEVKYLPEIISVTEDKLMKLPENERIKTIDKIPVKPSLDNSAGIVGATDAWSMGITGRGWYIAVLDTGIRKTHEMFEGKNVIEACYSGEGDCPNGGTQMTGAGAADHNYNITHISGYDHGTHVTGIAAGKSKFRAGISKDSNIIAVQIFSYFPGDDDIGSWSSDQIKGLEFVYQNRNNYNIASVNMSIGGGKYGSFCNEGYYNVIIRNLMNAGIATVIASGNESYCNAVSFPACIKDGISVGATKKNDWEANFSNWQNGMVDLFAPGVDIFSATAKNDTSHASWQGTSMAAPHVAGAWGLLKQLDMNMTVAKALKLLQDNGKMIATNCFSGGKAARIDVGESILSLLKVAPPLNFSGIQNTNKSVLQIEYLNTLTWEANPFNANKGKNITKYLIYTVDNYELAYLAEVPSDTFIYHHRKITQGTKYTYAIRGITDQGEESIPSYFEVE
ncbi:MAG: S8 family serine peptidase [Acidobacteriota bacterium]